MEGPSASTNEIVCQAAHFNGVATDAEYAAGPHAWSRLPHAFDELLDPVS